MNPNTPNHTASLRQQLLEKRAAQEPRDVSMGALRIRARLYTWLATQQEDMRAQQRDEPLNIAAFWSLPAEPELQPLLNKWDIEDNGLTLSLPCIDAEAAPLRFSPWDIETPMKTGRYNISEPDSSETAAKPDIILVPTLGFTRQGDRLGYGQGYYDRTIAQLRAQYHPFVTIGIAWSCGDLSEYDYTPEPHDEPLDAVLTELGWAKEAPQL